MKIAVILGAVVVILLVGVYTIGPVIAEKIAFKHLTPEQRAEYKDWRTKKLILPPEALEAKPFSKATEAAAVAYRAAWGKYKDKAINLWEANCDPKTGRLSGRDSLNYGALGRGLAEIEPLTHAYETLVTQPDYVLSAFSAGEVMGIDQYITQRTIYTPNLFPDFLSVQTGCKILQLKSLALAHEGKMAEAFNAAEKAVLASHVESYDTLISQLIAVAICSIGSSAWHELVTQCSDASLLRATLERQNKLAKGFAFFSNDLPITAVDRIGILRDFKRRGLDLDFQGMTAPRLAAMCYEAQADYLERFVLPKVQEDPTLVAQVRKNIEGMHSSSATMGGKSYNAKGYLMKAGAPWVSPMLYAIGLPNFLEARTRARVTLGKFDLLRLETARKLYGLEHGGATPALPADLVPAYLPALPTDRFAEPKAPYKEGNAEFYSIGPDRKDNGGAPLYDPSNGTISAGDLKFVH